MRPLYALIFILIWSSSSIATSYESLRFPPECTLQAVAWQMGSKMRPDIPTPKVHLASQTNIEIFQNALFEQWGFKPSEIGNAYDIQNNEIYLIDDSAYYKRHNRMIDDSFAHELVHYIQVRYRRIDIQTDEFAEFEAVAIQDWYRKNYMNTGKSPCSE